MTNKDTEFEELDDDLALSMARAKAIKRVLIDAANRLNEIVYVPEDDEYEDVSSAPEDICLNGEEITKFPKEPEYSHVPFEYKQVPFLAATLINNYSSRYNTFADPLQNVYKSIEKAKKSWNPEIDYDAVNEAIEELEPLTSEDIEPLTPEERWVDDCMEKTAQIVSNGELHGDMERTVTNELTRTYIDRLGHRVKASMTCIYKVTKEEDYSNQFAMSAEQWVKLHKNDVHLAFDVDDHGLTVLVNKKRELWLSEKAKIINKGIVRWHTTLLEKVVFPAYGKWLAEDGMNWEAFQDMFNDCDISKDAFYRARRKYRNNK